MSEYEEILGFIKAIDTKESMGMSQVEMKVLARQLVQMVMAKKGKCISCQNFRKSISSNLEGICLLSKTDNVVMVAGDDGCGDDPVLYVSSEFGCNYHLPIFTNA